MERVVEFEDLGFDRRLFTAARPAALGGAYTAVGDDVHALVYNPAGLARVRRIDCSIGFQYERNYVDNAFYGMPASLKQTSINLDYLSLAMPYPTYRGSLVGSFGIYREYSANLDLTYRGLNDEIGTIDEYILQQTGSIFSYNLGFGLDLSPRISMGLTIILLDGTINALTQWSIEQTGPLVAGDTYQEFLLDDLEADVDGKGGRIGLRLHPHPDVQVGIVLTSPMWISLHGTAYQEETKYQIAAEDSFFTGEFGIGIDYRTPFHFDFGLSYRYKYLLAAVDIGYSDWSQSSVNKVRLRGSEGQTPQREALDLKVGLEISVPKIPVQIRGGYAYQPYSLSYLLRDRIYASSKNYPTLLRASVDQERQIFSVGLGGVFGRVLSMDVAYQYLSGKRSLDSLEDERNQHRLLLSSSYHF